MGIDVRYSGQDFLQTVQDERGAAYLLLDSRLGPRVARGSADGLLHLPIHPDKPFVVFNEHQTILTGFERSTTTTRPAMFSHWGA